MPAAKTSAALERKQLLPDSKMPHNFLSRVSFNALTQAVLWWLETPNQYSALQMADMLFATLHDQKP